MIDPFEEPQPLRTSINRQPNSAERAEAMKRAEAKREKRAEVAQTHKPAPRKLRDLGFHDRLARMRAKKAKEGRQA